MNEIFYINPLTKTPPNRYEVDEAYHARLCWKWRVILGRKDEQTKG